ncbi:hypothetical protein QR680_016353 [Steinernema hermaphroditum]|uniref:Ground-like domain-containing protein n=1 Tax=Steinernema hermaphroditum TaxID=289476 RepID=A0AA39HD48_9BILA|nr:hypothetical protein QR680_016353 [Steinernema hermaphroditum]
MNGYLQIVCLIVAVATVAESCFAPPSGGGGGCCCPPPPPPSCGCGCGRKKREAVAEGDRLCPEPRFKSLIEKSLKADAIQSKAALQKKLEENGFSSIFVICAEREFFEKAAFGTSSTKYCVHGNEEITCNALVIDT